MNLIKDGFSKIKDRLTKTEIQRKLKEATSNEHCHANVSLLDEIAAKTSNYSDFQVIVSHCVKKLSSKKEKWRKILKTLLLIEHILKVGSPNFYDSMKSESHMLKNLHSFSFIDANRADKGETIRQKSKELLVLLNDKQKLKAERESYAKWKGRIEGVSSTGKIGSVGSMSYSNSISSDDHNKNYVSKSEAKEEEKQSDSESSEDSEEEEKKKKPVKKVKKIDDKAEKVFEEETSIKGTTKASAHSNISIKKPGVGKKEAHENFDPFDNNRSPNHEVNDINDIFCNKSKTEVRSNQQQSGNNSNSLIDFISFTNPQDVKQNTTAPKNRENNIPFDLNFNLTGQTSSKNVTDMPNISTIPVYSNNNQKLETNELLKMMYSDNSQNKVMNSNVNFNSNNNLAFNPFNNNTQNLNPQKPQTNTINPYDLQFNNMNINSSANNANPMTWNNNLNANHNNSWGNNMNNNQGNNFSGGYNQSNQNSMNYNKNSNVAYGNSNNNQAYNFPGNNTNIYNNTSKNVQTKLNDDDFKEVEEESFKFESKGKGLSSLLDNKLVNLGDLKGNNNNKVQASNSNNYNFNY